MSSILKVDTIQDASGNAIISSDGSGNLSIPNLTTTGDINFGDNDKANFGAGNDLQIYHDGSNSYIQDAGTGNLLIKSDGSGTYVRNASDQNIISAQGDEARMHYAGPVKLKTTSTGIDVTGTVTADGISLGDNETINVGASNDLQIYHTGGQSYIQDEGTGNLKITSNAAGVDIQKGTTEFMGRFITDGAVELYYDNSKKFETTSSGIDVTGTASADIINIYNASPQGRLNVSNNGAEQLEVFPGDVSNKVTLQAFNRSTVASNSFRYIASTHEFITGGSERMRIDSSGRLLLGVTTASGFQASSTVKGTILYDNSIGGLATNFDSGSQVNINRIGSDGTLVQFERDGNLQGSISVSGSTVSYNGFTGTHWSRLADKSKPTILKGTILESLDEMMDWYQVQFDITETDDEGNETTRTEKQSYPLGDGESVGDVITYNYEGTDYQATIIQEDDIKHTKSKISDTVDAKNVYGVFMAWDNDDDTVNDMYVAQTGTFVVRINGSETVSKGDLIQSNGDGTGKVQADDLLRASTVAKVISTTKVETYDDGSYIVPCTLHC